MFSVGVGAYDGRGGVSERLNIGVHMVLSVVLVLVFVCV